MRIISGQFKGYAIPIVKDSDYRPSKGKVKEAIFNILQSSDLIKDSIVLDLYCGTAALAIEAVSRGAKCATVIDIEKKYIKGVETFIDKYKIKNIETIATDASNLKKPDLEYDLVFIDPPYKQDLASKSLHSLKNKGWLADKAIIIIELARAEELAPISQFTELDVRLYGITKILIWRYEKV